MQGKLTYTDADGAIHTIGEVVQEQKISELQDTLRKEIATRTKSIPHVVRALKYQSDADKVREMTKTERVKAMPIKHIRKEVYMAENQRLMQVIDVLKQAEGALSREALAKLVGSRVSNMSSVWKRLEAKGAEHWVWIAGKRGSKTDPIAYALTPNAKVMKAEDVMLALIQSRGKGGRGKGERGPDQSIHVVIPDRLPVNIDHQFYPKEGIKPIVLPIVIEVRVKVIHE